MNPEDPKDPQEIVTSHPEKIFYPDDGVSKGDVVEHYRTVAHAMVPHLRGRPLTMRRFPNGITQQSWFQKSASGHFPEWIRVEEIAQRHTDPVRYVMSDDEATLVYLANQAVVEFHIWTSRAPTLDHPDLIVFDLDPPPQGIEVSDLREVARQVRSLYRKLGLTAYLQATGGRGFHVVAPLDATTEYDTVHTFSQEAAEYLAARDPDRLTTEFRKNKRGDRIFLDTNRNGYAQTFIAPYSLRSRSGAAVATPLDWTELGKAQPDGWDIRRIKQRLTRKKDPWRNMDEHAASAAEALEKLRSL